MDSTRQALHNLVDDLPDEALQSAEAALKYCMNPGGQRLTIDKARERVLARARQNLEEHTKRLGHGLITGVGSGSGGTMANGDFHHSMLAWDDGPVTYHMRGLSGHVFEMYERLELAKDGSELVLTQKFAAPDGSEQLLTTKLPVSKTAG